MNSTQHITEIKANQKLKYYGKKPFEYCVRLPIPIQTSKTSMYGYTQILFSFIEKLSKQLKSQNRKFKGGAYKEGYDQNRGRYIEKIIIAYTNSGNEINKKIIWIER